MKVTTAQLVDAFTEWDLRFRANPEDFENFAVTLLEGNSFDYGFACAHYFKKLLKEFET